jgi:hypothetical protein
MTTSFPKPYLIGKTYYFKYTDRTGVRYKKSTGYKRKVDAHSFIHSFIGRTYEFIQRSPKGEVENVSKLRN